MKLYTGCPPGSYYSACAMPCNELCLEYLQKMRKKGYCEEEDGCIEGCVSDENDCTSQGLVWKNNVTCVPESSCECVSRDKKIVKVHTNKCNILFQI